MRILALVAAFGAFCLYGCGAATVNTSPASQPTATNQPTATPASVARLGDSVRVAGLATTLSIKLLAVSDPAKHYGSYNAPRSGRHYCAVKLAISNVGEAVYNDSPVNCCQLIDTRDIGYSASIFDEIGPGFGSVRIAPGARRVGWVTFDLPDKAAPATLQYTSDSGFADETAQWELR